MLDVRFRLLLIGIMTLVIALVWTFPRWYPLLDDDSIAEVFPGLVLEAQPDFLQLPQQQRDTFFTLYYGDEDREIEPRPEAALALVEARLLTDDVFIQPETPFTSPPGATVVREGEFRTVDPVRGAAGNATIYRLSDQTLLLHLDETFRSTRAPDMHLILTRNPDPLDERGVGVDYIDLGTLQGNAGEQIYSVPSELDFSVYPILALYAQNIDTVISTATLR